jgi:hypothetical protein
MSHLFGGSIYFNNLGCQQRDYYEQHVLIGAIMTRRNSVFPIVKTWVQQLLSPRPSQCDVSIGTFINAFSPWANDDAPKNMSLIIIT